MSDNLLQICRLNRCKTLILQGPSSAQNRNSKDRKYQPCAVILIVYKFVYFVNNFLLSVSNSDFRNQLVEVRSAYKILSGTWPSSLENERTLFDKAVAGWILTLDIWDYKLDPGVFSFEDLLLERAKNYSGYNYESANLIMIDQWIGIIMGLAGQYFSDGKASISEKID